MSDDTIVIPTNPVDITAINKAIQEGVDCMLRIDAEKDLMKDILEVVKEKYAIKPKHMRKMIKLKYKGTFDQENKENEDFSALYETVVK